MDATSVPSTIGPTAMQGSHGLAAMESGIAQQLTVLPTSTFMGSLLKATLTISATTRSAALPHASTVPVCGKSIWSMRQRKKMPYAVAVWRRAMQLKPIAPGATGGITSCPAASASVFHAKTTVDGRGDQK